MNETTFLLALSKEEVSVLDIMLETYRDTIENFTFDSTAGEVVARAQLPAIKSIQNKLKGGNHGGDERRRS